MLLHLFLSLLNQWWCQFGAATDEKSEYPSLGPLRVLDMGWLWCWPYSSSAVLFLFFRTNWIRLLVCCGYNIKIRSGYSRDLGIHALHFDILSLSPPPCTVSRVTVWRAWWVYIHHTSLVSHLLWFDLVLWSCLYIPVLLGLCGSGRRWDVDPLSELTFPLHFPLPVFFELRRGLNIGATLLVTLLFLVWHLDWLHGGCISAKLKLTSPQDGCNCMGCTGPWVGMIDGCLLTEL